MSESYTAAAIAALSAPVYNEEKFVEILFPGYTARFCTLDRSYTLSGDTYIGTGKLGRISDITEKTDFTAEPITLTLSGLDNNVVSALQVVDHQGSPVTITVAQFDTSDVIIADPVEVFVGAVDTMSWEIGKTTSVTILVDHFLRLMLRGGGDRRMQANQEAIFPATKGLDYAASMTNSITWGVKNDIPSPEQEIVNRRNTRF